MVQISYFFSFIFICFLGEGGLRCCCDVEIDHMQTLIRIVFVLHNHCMLHLLIK